MHILRTLRHTLAIATLAVLAIGCNDRLDEPALNRTFNEEIDYSLSRNIVLPTIGAYADFYSRGWETIPLISVRGDDVNAGGLGDQQDFDATDRYMYNKDYWMYNSLWQLNYSDIYNGKTAIQQIERYREAGASDDIADQYTAEVEVLNGFLLYYLTQVWGDVFIPNTGDPTDLLVSEVASREQVLAYLSEQMATALPALSTVHPADRTDIPGGVNRYTALAIKARVDLELGNYEAVAAATSEIINSGVYELYDDYYELFKLPGELSRENLLELQYSDYNQPSGDENFHLYNFYGPQGWTPAVEGAGSGWGFFEPSLKFIKFMLDRGETTRLETSVLFTDRGIAELRTDPDYQDLPPFVNNTTRDGDVINDYARALFASGKHYLPSDELTPGRTRYGTSKNYICIRYAEVLLMHAEALTRGASGTAISAVDAVNLVRTRAGLGTLSAVTLDDIAAEKFAELAMEWGIRYYDLIRWERYDELEYGGRDFNAPEDIYLPYPQNQVDQLPALEN
jgi:hypothetical protein